MKTDTANFLVEQLNPLFRKSKSYIRKLKVDADNQDIMMDNLFKATIYRVHYGSKKIVDVVYEIMENARE